MKLLRLFFIIEMAILFVFFLVGPNGIITLINLQNENESTKTEVANLKNEITKLNSDIQKWNTNPFYKEKMAREVLQMAKSGEEVYRI